MSGPGKLHAVVAALVIGLVALAFALGVFRYADSQRSYQTSQYEALAAALQLANAVPGEAADEVIAQKVEEEAGSLGRSGRIDRLFFVRKGKKIPSLNISKPAKLIVDLGRRGGTDEEQEELVTLSARLEKHFGEGGTAATLDHRVLTWTIGAPARRVAAWPVLTDDGFQGIAGVEVLPDAPPQSPVTAGGAALVALLGLFALGLWTLGRRLDQRLIFGVAAVVVVLATTIGTYRDQRARTETFVATRDHVTTRFVNRVAWHEPDGLRQLDALWNRIYKAPADGLTVAPIGDDSIGTLLCVEGEDVVSSLAWDRTLPVLIVVGVTLLIGLLLLPGLAALIHGLMTMPGVYAYVAPAMAGMTLLVLIPFIMGVGLGFFNMDYEFVGLENFSDILFPTATSQTNFYYTLGFTILWTVSNVVLHVSIGLFMALILNNKKVRLRGLFRVLLIIPWAIPNYVTALIWKWMFTSQIGAINLMMEAVGMTPINWFGPTFWTNFFAVLATNTWLGFPFMMVVSLGALQSIPNELYEAADIDGASRWQKFRNVTLPLLKPALFPAIILGTIWTFNMFNIIYLVTRGQPDNKTNILITEAYRFFAELNQYGVAAAYCVLIFFILLGYTLVTNRITRATEGAFE